MKIYKRLIYILSISFVLNFTDCVSMDTESKSIRFIQLTDTHFGTKGYLNRISRITRQINNLKLKIDFVVLTGDISNRAEYNSEDFKRGFELLTGLKYPLYFVAGGRDIIPRSERTFEKTMNEYKQIFGAPISVYQINGYRCIFLYVSSLLLLQDYYGYKPLNLLTEILETDPEYPTLLFMHEPPMEHDNFDEWTDDSLRRLQEINLKYNIIGIISGHWHQDALGWLNDTPIFVSDSVYTVFEGVDVDSNFRVYTVTDNKISYINIEIDE